MYDLEYFFARQLNQQIESLQDMDLMKLIYIKEVHVRNLKELRDKQNQVQSQMNSKRRR